MEKGKKGYREVYKKKIGNFQDYRITHGKFEMLKQLNKKALVINFRRGLLAGLFFESLIILTPICSVIAP